MARDATGSVMRAGDVGRAARRDLQFRIPRRPVVRLGLRARPEETGWIIDGARKSQVLGGAFAREHMGPLLQACDGTRTLDEIGEVTGIGPQAAFEAVSLLWTGGIVEEGDTEPAPGDPAPELARLLSRLGDSTGVNDSWQDAARRLAAARVAVVGDAELAGEMVAALEATLPEVRLDSAPRRGDTLTVLIETVDSTDRSQEVARRCREEGIALLRVRAEQEAVTVGPYVDEAFSPCLACACADEPEIGPRPEAARRDIVVGLAARAVAALIARATVTHLPGDARRTDLATFTYSDRPVVSRPGCPVCSVAGAGEEPVPVAPSAPVGARYEQSVAIPPAAFVDSKGHQQHYKPSNLRLQREFRDWPVCPRTPLPPADLERLDQPWPIAHPLTDDGAEPDVLARPTLSELATILALSVGVREPLGAEPTGAEPVETPQAPLSAKLRRWTAGCRTRSSPAPRTPTLTACTRPLSAARRRPPTAPSRSRPRPSWAWSATPWSTTHAPGGRTRRPAPWSPSCSCCARAAPSPASTGCGSTASTSSAPCRRPRRSRAWRCRRSSPAPAPSSRWPPTSMRPTPGAGPPATASP